MSPELAAALAYYREWLRARKRQQEAEGWMETARAKLSREDDAEYERHAERIKAEIEE